MPVRAQAWLFVLLASASCNVLFNAARDEVIDEIVEEASPGDLPVTPPAATDLISVNSIIPNRGEVGGGTLVEIIGLGFESVGDRTLSVTVLFGDAPAPEATVTGDDRIRTVAPAQALGVVDVAVVITAADSELPQGNVVAKGTLANGFEFFEPVALTAIAPNRGPTVGGTRILAEGRGFVSGTTVKLDGGPALPATLIDSTRIEVTTPRLPHAVYDVTVANPNGAATLPDAFSVYELVRVREVVPFVGPLTGGTPIVVRGVGFVAPSTLSVGAVELTNAANPDETELQAVTAPPVPPSEGAVDVTVTNETGTHTLRQGFVFVDASVTTPRIVAVTPAVGLVAGGNTVHIAGVGFSDGPTTAYFSATAAACTVLADTAIDCVAPPHPEGTVNVRVVTRGMDALAVNAYTYIELRADVLVPDRGAVAGGTYVVLYGNGFGGELDVTLNEAPARDITVLDAHRVALRTPPGALGPADLKITRDGLELAVGGLFTYFDPINTREWSSGGPVDGAVNVSVIDDDGRVEGAFVMLGTDPTTPYQGFANARGQITFSGPEVVGLQTVSAGKAGHTNFSWVDVDAANLVMWIPKAPEMGSGTPSCGAHPPIIRGNVSRIKDEYNTGFDYVVVTTTYMSFSFPLPDPGSGAFLQSQGPYELRARTGDMVVLALAGTDDGEGFLQVHAMGFHPFMFTEAGSETACASDDDCTGGEVCHEYGEKNVCGRIVLCQNDNDCAEEESCVPQGSLAVCVRPASCCVSNDNCRAERGELCMGTQPDKVCTRRYDNIDITVDTALRQQMRIDLDDPPLAALPEDDGIVPDETGAQVWYDFGYMGLHPMASVTVPATDVLFVPMPKELPGGLAGSEIKMIVGTYLAWDPNSGAPHQAQSEVYLEDLVDTTVPIDATPFLGTQRELAPAFFDYVGDPMHFEFSVNREVRPSANVHALYDENGNPTWLLFTPAATTRFDLPVFPPVAADIRQPGGMGYWQLYGMYAPGALFNRLDPDVLFSWRSRAVYLTLFIVP